MKVLLVNGSPHLEGCTYTALRAVADTLEAEGITTEIFQLGTQPVPGCIACNFCKKNGRCYMDDVVNVFIEKAKDCDGFVFGSPVHFAGAGGTITSFMDRAFYSNRGLLAAKPAAAIASCRRGGSSTTFDQLNKYFTINCMPIVSSQYWNQVHGNTPEEVLQDQEGMQTMRTLGQHMAWLLACIDAGLAAGIQAPQRETEIKTNFIR